MLNKAYTRFQPLDSGNIRTVAGIQRIEPGQALVSTVDPTTLSEAAQPSAGTANEGSFVGFAWAERFAPKTNVSSISLPALSSSLSPINLPVVPNSVTVFIGGALATADNAAPTAAGHYYLNGNQVQFSNADITSGASVQVLYNYNVSLAEAESRYGDYYAGQDPTQATGTIGYIRRGRVFTNMFDPTQVWTGAIRNVTVGPNGTVTRGGNGIAIPNARILRAPDDDTPFLGLEFSC